MAIVKILSRHTPSFGALIRYQLRYMLNDIKTGKGHVYTQNLRPDTIEGYVKQFLDNESFRRISRRDKVILTHEIISFHEFEDQTIISPEMIDDLAYTYMRLRGEEGVMLGALHRDKNHLHYHFCTSALEFRTGKSFGLSKAKLHELKTSFQEYHKEKYPELDKSFPEHGKGGLYKSNTQMQIEQRETVVQTMEECFDQSTSQGEFLELLQAEQLFHYESSDGVPLGVTYRGIKYKFSTYLENREFDSLLSVHNEEERALAEIRAVRERQVARDSIERDGEERAR